MTQAEAMQQALRWFRQQAAALEWQTLDAAAAQLGISTRELRETCRQHRVPLATKSRGKTAKRFVHLPTLNAVFTERAVPEVVR